MTTMPGNSFIFISIIPGSCGVRLVDPKNLPQHTLIAHPDRPPIVYSFHLLICVGDVNSLQ